MPIDFDQKVTQNTSGRGAGEKSIKEWSCLCTLNIVSSPDPDFQQLRVDYITATWKVGLGNKNDTLVPSVPKH